MRHTAVLLGLLCAIGLATIHAQQVVHAQQTDYESLKAQAEKYYADSSYSKARETYLKASKLNLPPDEKRWVAFRLADTLWRSESATNTSDGTKYDEAQNQLQELVRDVQREEDRDLVWAEVHESLGDFWWLRKGSHNWQMAWQNYQQAFDYWGGSADIDTARDRYLKIVWRISHPVWGDASYYYGYYGNYVPLEILDNALGIARTEQDRAHLHYLIAMTLRSQGGDLDRLRR